MNKPVTVFNSGASSSEEKPRYDLIPHEAMTAVAKRFALGARTHGDRNYENGWNDAAFIRDRFNHLIEHAMRAANGDTSEDHLGAVLCNAAILIRLHAIATDHEITRQFGTDLPEAR
jgi:hypothetical protein